MTWHLKDSDERACAYIAGAAPNRWGNFTSEQQQGRRAGEVVPPVQLEHNAPAEEQKRAAEIRRAHPLYASIALGEWGGPCGGQEGEAGPALFSYACAAIVSTGARCSAHPPPDPLCLQACLLRSSTAGCSPRCGTRRGGGAGWLTRWVAAQRGQ